MRLTVRPCRCSSAESPLRPGPRLRAPAPLHQCRAPLGRLSLCTPTCATMHCHSSMRPHDIDTEPHLHPQLRRMNRKPGVYEPVLQGQRLRRSEGPASDWCKQEADSTNKLAASLRQQSPAVLLSVGAWLLCLHNRPLCSRWVCHIHPPWVNRYHHSLSPIRLHDRT